MKGKGLGDCRIARAFLADGIAPFLPPRFSPFPRPGRDWSDADGHLCITHIFTLPRVRVSIPLQNELFVMMENWVQRFDVSPISTSGDLRNRGFSERDMWPIRHCGYYFRWREIAGSLDHWMVKNGRGGASFILRLTLSPYLPPDVRPRAWRSWSV